MVMITKVYYFKKTYGEYVSVFCYIIKNDRLILLFESELVFGYEEEIEDYINNHTEIKNYELINLEEI